VGKEFGAYIEEGNFTVGCAMASIINRSMKTDSGGCAGGPKGFDASSADRPT